jgi:hypothetical protein
LLPVSFDRCDQTEGTFNMNPVTSFLVFACVLAGLAIGNWVNFYGLWLYVILSGPMLFLSKKHDHRKIAFYDHKKVKDWYQLDRC